MHKTLCAGDRLVIGDVTLECVSKPGRRHMSLRIITESSIPVVHEKAGGVQYPLPKHDRSAD